MSATGHHPRNEVDGETRSRRRARQPAPMVLVRHGPASTRTPRDHTDRPADPRDRMPVRGKFRRAATIAARPRPRKVPSPCVPRVFLIAASHRCPPPMRRPAAPTPVPAGPTSRRRRPTPAPSASASADRRAQPRRERAPPDAVDHQRARDRLTSRRRDRPGRHAVPDRVRQRGRRHAAQRRDPPGQPPAPRCSRATSSPASSTGPTTCPPSTPGRTPSSAPSTPTMIGTLTVQ